MKTSYIKLPTGLFFLLASLAAYASEAPFMATAVVTDGSGLPAVIASGSNFQDFTTNITEVSGQFQGFSGHSYNSNVTFLGVPNAILYSTNNTGTVVTMKLTPIGFAMTFTGTSKDDVKTQINNFFEKNGAGILASFLKAVSQTSPIAVTDGNPNAATAVAANSVFLSAAMTPATDVADQAAGAKPQFGGLALGFDTGGFTAGSFSGNNYDLSLTALNIGFGDRVRLQVPVDFNYLTVSGAKVGGAGVTFVLPIRISIMDQNNPVNWRLIPLAGVNARASVDLAGGAALWEAGAISSVDFKVSPKLVLCLMDQYTLNKSFSIKEGSYSFNPQVNQGILKNGVRVVTPLTKRVILDCFVVETNFINAAEIKNFTTVGACLSLRATKSYNLSIAGNYDTGTAFKSWSVGLTSAWHW